MGNYNYFGCTAQDCVDRFANGDYAPAPTDFGTLTTIQKIMDSCESQLADALGPEVFTGLIFPRMVQLCWRATQGQLVFQAPTCLLPMVPNSMSMWWGSPMMFQLEPRKRGEIGTSWGNNDALQGGGITFDDSRWNTGNYRLYELALNQFTYDPVGGVCTLANPPGPANQDDLVYASWQTDITNVLFGLSNTSNPGNKSLPSLASLLADGVASRIGPLVYSQSQGQEWQAITELKNTWDEALDAFSKQTRIITELRTLRWWKQIEKATPNGACTTSRYRGG